MSQPAFPKPESALRLRQAWRCRLATLLAGMVGILLAGSSELPGHSPTEQEAARVARLIQQLGDDEFAVREDAGAALEAIGESALPALRQAVVAGVDPETRRRAERLVQDIVARQELVGLQGTWHSTSVEVDGVGQAGENKLDRHVFSGDQVICKDGETVVQTGTVRIVEVSDDLVKMDFSITDSAHKGDTWVGIYQRRGDELKWCGGYLGQGCVRPSAFATRPGDGYFLRTLKRDPK